MFNRTKLPNNDLLNLCKNLVSPEVEGKFKIDFDFNSIIFTPESQCSKLDLNSEISEIKKMLTKFGIHPLKVEFEDNCGFIIRWGIENIRTLESDFKHSDIFYNK